MLKLISAMDMNFESIIDYRDSFEILEEISPAVDIVENGNRRDYLVWLMENPIYRHYFLVDDGNPNYILGNGSIDIYSNYHLEQLNLGTVGGCVRPSERRKHYATHLLLLLLNKCMEFGMQEVCVSCLESNFASKSLIEKNGGKLEKKFFDDDSASYGLKYWIKLDATYKEINPILLKK